MHTQEMRKLHEETTEALQAAYKKVASLFREACEAEEFDERDTCMMWARKNYVESLSGLGATIEAMKSAGRVI